ncbi:MAG: peptidylprolyl isomerase, partial [Deltaproteobacteria bacterium]|nr:peptidylprolyl isomerase [Deltaproteobacteria bacterium]
MRASKSFRAALGCAVFVLCSLASSASSASSASGAEKQPQAPAAGKSSAGGPVATVNGTAIPRSDVERIVRELQQNAKAAGSPAPDEAKLRPEIVKRLVQGELLYQLSLKHPVKDLKKRADEGLEQLKKQAPSPQAFQERLKQTSTTEKDLKAMLMKRISIQEYVKSQILPGVKVTEEQAKKFYGENKAKFTSPEQVRASHILLQVPPAAKQEDRSKAYAKAKELQARAAKGEDFVTLAKENSQDPGSATRGGDLGFFAKEQMIPAFSTAAFALKPGQVSDVVETPYGYHIIKLTERKAPAQQSFDQVK